MGIGNAIGPFIGAVLYNYFGYDWAFFSFGLFVITVSLYAHFTKSGTSDKPPT